MINVAVFSLPIYAEKGRGKNDVDGGGLPVKIRVSAGSASALGLRYIRSDEMVTAVHLLVGADCAFSCSFCPQARTNQDENKEARLSRVQWPAFEMGTLVDALARAYSRNEILRVCLQVVPGGSHAEQTQAFFAILNERNLDIPVSVNAVIASLDDAAYYLDHGAQRIGLALDGATPALFSKHKGSLPETFSHRLSLLETLAKRYPNRVATHLIVGLGETERDMIFRIDQMKRMGVEVALFALTPLKGTQLSQAQPPSMASYRRVQLARHLITEQGVDPSNFDFDSTGRLRRIYQFKTTKDLIRGDPFRTSGCVGCNRPFYNERPGEIPYNYPRALTPEEASEALYMTDLPEFMRQVAGGGRLL